jgi:hypothetical protein
MDAFGSVIGRRAREERSDGRMIGIGMTVMSVTAPVHEPIEPLNAANCSRDGGI